MAFGITAQGFVTKPIENSKSEIEALMQSVFGTGVDLTASEPLGQIVGILSEREQELWALAQASYAARYPDTATGDALVEVCALTGTVPLEPTRSLVTVTMTGNAGVVVAQGKQASVAGGGAKFQSRAVATLVALTAWQSAHVYAAGDRASNGGNAYVVIAPGTSAGSGGPAGQGSDIVDGTVHWRFLGVGAAAVDASFESVDVGPKAANAFSLTTIETPVAGWSGTINLLDASPGRDYETDEQLRLRREVELRSQGAAAADAIRADVLDTVDAAGVKFVTACKVFVNDTDATDGNGIPPHGINVIALYAGAPDSAKDAAIRASIFASKAAGIATSGAVSGTLVDDSGTTQTVKFDYPTEKDVWIIVNVTKDAATWPADGVTQVKNALLAFAAGYGLGDDVIVSHLFPPVIDRVSGVSDVGFLVGFANPPVASANLAIAPRELAVLDSSRIAVNVT